MPDDASAGAVREVCFDTETTGYNPEGGDRMVEIGCVELLDLLPTGKTLHFYIDPERDVPEGAVEVHGLTRPKLRQLGAKRFSIVADQILEFFGDSPLIAHNAPFDIRFMNAELAKARRPLLKNPVIDTVKLAKQQFGTANASLDALCKRFNISLDGRAYHGALIDTQLLAQVYLELRGGRARSFVFDEQAQSADGSEMPQLANLVYRKPRLLGYATPEELIRHKEFVARLKDSVWAKLPDFQNTGEPLQSA